MIEEWLDIPGYGGHYQASTLGRIKSKARIVTKRNFRGQIVRQKYGQKVLNPTINNYGYLTVHISVDGKKMNRPVHHLVLFAFVGPRPNGMEACHNNGKSFDNRPENLRWDTHANNNADRKTHGTYATCEKHVMAKLSWDVVKKIRTENCTGQEAAKKYGVGPSQISRIRRNVSWVTQNP